jgi:hypothetical protein
MYHDNRKRFDPIIASLFILACLIISPLLVPNLCCDRGIWVSVAERLLAGDHLYRDVYDNKDPIFFYFLAGQRALGPWAQVAVEVLLIGIVSSASYFIGILTASRWAAAVIALIAVPIILTGRYYIPGYAFLPAASLIMTGAAASAYGRQILAGICVGLLLFTKINLFPIGFAAVAGFLLTRYRPSEIFLFAATTVVTLSVVICALSIRGEFWPYLEIMKSNVIYSTGAVVGEKTGLALLAAHFNSVSKPWVASIAIANCLIAFYVWKLHPRKGARLAILTASILTFLSSLLVYSLTGIFNHHNQLFMSSAVFAAIGLSPLIDLCFKPSRLYRIATLGGVIASAFILAGLPRPSKYQQGLNSFASNYRALGELPVEAKRLLATGSSGTYARLGTNDDDGHAYGLGNWKLACPRFHQYDFEPDIILDSVISCASKAPTLIVSETFAQDEPVRQDAYGYSWHHTSERWAAFVARAEQMLADKYTCDGDPGHLRICKRKGQYQ